MRCIGWILFSLLVVGWIAAEMPPLVTPAESVADDLWRRSSDGWEQATWLLPRPAPRSVWLHPAVLATLQITVSVAGFWIATHSQPPEPRDHAPASVA